MRGLIIGASGQDGRILWDQLIAQGDDLAGVSRQGVNSSQDRLRPSVDISSERDVSRLIEEFVPDEIYFLAAHHHSSEDRASRNGEVWHASWQTHVEALRNFLEAIRIARIPARLFYASSSRVFGTPDVSPQTEETPLKPGCLYGITKAAGMMLARHYRETHGVWVSCGILYNHESPLRGREFVSQRIVRGLVAVKRRVQPRLEIGDLQARVDWGYAPDYTRAMTSILRSNAPRDFVVATGTTHSVQEMVEIVADYLELDWREAVVENRSVLQRPSLPLCGNSALLRAATGWAPKQTFAGMIRLMVDAALQA